MILPLSLVAETATGVVYHDLDGDQVRDEGEAPAPGVRVSNGRDIVFTDAGGRYELEVDDDDIIFVIKPRGWRTVIDEHQLPRFYYIHKPNGSPPDFRYPGVKPTGPLPESVDFPLYRQEEPEQFKAIFFADPQPRDQREVDYVTHDVVEELIGVDASFGVSLGDVMFDNLDLYESLNGRVAMIGIPWYNVIGNHDINYDAHTDEHSDETWERVFGPPYYSFDHGPVHFLVLDDVVWTGPTQEGERGRYRGGIGEDQMTFIRNDLAAIPEGQLVVLMMHIPLIEVDDRHELYRLIEQRPAAMSISGHTHYQEHRLIDHEDGWNGPEPHHHIINVTVSGSWWSGLPDENGIPHTTMRDGAPNGYSIMTFDGARYSWEFKAARRPSNFQMNIYLPSIVNSAETGATEVVVNVFGGSDKSTVEMRINDGDWRRMRQSPRQDPYFADLKKIEETEESVPGRKLPRLMETRHIWAAHLPAAMPAGTYTINIRTTDIFGQTYEDQRILEVRE